MKQGARQESMQEQYQGSREMCKQKSSKELGKKEWKKVPRNKARKYERKVASN